MALYPDKERIPERAPSIIALTNAVSVTHVCMIEIIIPDITDITTYSFSLSFVYLCRMRRIIYVPIMTFGITNSSIFIIQSNLISSLSEYLLPGYEFEAVGLTAYMFIVFVKGEKDFHL